MDSETKTSIQDQWQREREEKARANDELWRAVESFAMPGTAIRNKDNDTGEDRGGGRFAMLHEGYPVLVSIPWGVGGYRSAGKVQFNAGGHWIPGYDEMHRQRGDGGIKPPASIQINPERGAATMEKELRRRLLPGALRYQNELRARIQEYQNDQTASARFVELLQAATGRAWPGSPSYNPQPGRYSMHAPPLMKGASIDAELRSQSLEIKLSLRCDANDSFGGFDQRRAAEILAEMLQKIQA